jgi:hypothetical protein
MKPLVSWEQSQNRTQEKLVHNLHIANIGTKGWRKNKFTF